MALQQFKTKRELILAFALKVVSERSSAGWDQTTAEVLGRMTARYEPRLYRGGHVIPGFGYSTQFISPMLPLFKAAKKVGPRKRWMISGVAIQKLRKKWGIQ